MATADEELCSANHICQTENNVCSHPQMGELYSSVNKCSMSVIGFHEEVLFIFSHVQLQLKPRAAQYLLYGSMANVTVNSLANGWSYTRDRDQLMTAQILVMEQPTPLMLIPLT